MYVYYRYLDDNSTSCMYIKVISWSCACTLFEKPTFC